MNRKAIVTVFKLENLVLGLMISLFVCGLFIGSDRLIIRGASVGLFLGLWIGVLFNHFIQIPKTFGNKDERDLVHMLIAYTLGLGAATIIAFLLYASSVFNFFTIGPLEYIVSIAMILIVSMAIRYGAYSYLKNTL